MRIDHLTASEPSRSSSGDGRRTGAGSTDGSRASSDKVGSDTAEAFLHRHPWVVTVGRVGWIAKGAVYVLTGVLALKVGVDRFGGPGDGEEANQTGAISAVARQGFGPVLLGLLALGLFAFAAWRLACVLLPADNEAAAWLTRVGFAASALVYAGLGVSAMSLAWSPGSAESNDGGEDAKVERLTADVLGWPAGRVLVALVALTVIGIGIGFVWHGVTGRFERQLERRRVGPLPWRTVRALGVAGWVGRGAMMGLIGWFVLRAAVTYEASEARGLDDSLRRVADHPLGQAMVLVVSVGLLVYGAFCLVSAPIVKLVAGDDRHAAS